jgi:hypothetical protein
VRGHFAITLYVISFLLIGFTIGEKNRFPALAFMFTCGTMCDVRTLAEPKELKPDRKSAKL